MAEFEHLEEWVVGLHDRGVIGCANTPEEFLKLKSGRLSPHYANFRGIMSYDYELAKQTGYGYEKQMRVRELTVEIGAQCLNDIWNYRSFDHIAPIPQAVTQLGGAIALRSGISSLNVRVPEGEKGYGKHKPVEGSYQPGDDVVGFDDVVTTGQAKEEFIEPVKLAGLQIQEFFVLLDRQEGGKSAIETAGYDLTAAIGMYAVKDILFHNNRWTSQQHSYVADYLAQYGDMTA